MFRWLNKYESCNFQRLIMQQKLRKIKCSCFFIVRSKSYYQVLGLDSTASPKEIKSAYYKLSLQYHPDKNDGSEESVVKFREITEAYEVLSNPEKKINYDIHNKGGFQSEYPRHSAYGRSYYPPKSYAKPFTGKTKDFDFEEHFRKHYQESDERRQAEHEYFKRRWEAEFYRRYPNFDEYYKKRQYETYSTREEISKVYSRRRYVFLILFTMWIAMMLMEGVHNVINPDKVKRKTVYYKVNEENDDVQDKG